MIGTKRTREDGGREPEPDDVRGSARWDDLLNWTEIRVARPDGKITPASPARSGS